MRPATDVMLTMQPWRRTRISPTTALMHRSAPKKLVSIVSLKSSSEASSIAKPRPIPALLTSTSIGPNRRRASPNASVTDRSDVTSSASVLSASFSVCASAERSGAASGRRIVAITV